MSDVDRWFLRVILLLVAFTAGVQVAEHRDNVERQAVCR